MTNSILTRRQASERDCGKYILEHYQDKIIECLHKCSDSQFPMIVVYLGIYSESFDKLVFSPQTINKIKGLNAQSLEQSGALLFRPYVYDCIINVQKSRQHIPILVKWIYSEAFINDREEFILDQPLQHVGIMARPFEWAPESAKSTITKPKTVKPLEKHLEADLLKWLHMQGIQADNQIQTAKHRMDLWIPGKCFLELKTGKVSGDDVCQAISYCAEYRLPVVLVGNHIGEMASRGIEAFNKAVDGDLMAFVQWSAVKTYLKGLLGLTSNPF